MGGAREEYLRAVWKLSKAAGPEWQEFVARYSEHVAGELEHNQSVPTSEALVMLGTNRALVALRNDFQKIDKLIHTLKLDR